MASVEYAFIATVANKTKADQKTMILTKIWSNIKKTEKQKMLVSSIHLFDNKNLVLSSAVWEITAFITLITVFCIVLRSLLHKLRFLQCSQLTVKSTNKNAKLCDECCK